MFLDPSLTKGSELCCYDTSNKLLSPATSKSMELACPHEFATGTHIVNEQKTRKQYSEIIDNI